MRRIFKPGSVAPSEDIFVLDDGLPGDFQEDEFEQLEPGEDDIIVLDFDDGKKLPGESSEPDKDSDSTPPQPEDKKTKPARRSSARAERDIAAAEKLRDEIVQNAAAEAAKIVEKAHNEAMEMYRTAMEKAMVQIEKDREDAIKTGRAAAFEEHSDEISACISSIVEAICRMEAHQAKLISGFESDLKWLALEIVQKILKQKVEENPACLAPMVEAAVKSCKNAPWITVEISDSVPKLLTELQNMMARDGFGDRVTVKNAKAPADTCIIETPDKFFDASISQQLENLKGYFLSENEG